MKLMEFTKPSKGILNISRMYLPCCPYCRIDHLDRLVERLQVDLSNDTTQEIINITRVFRISCRVDRVFKAHYFRNDVQGHKAKDDDRWFVTCLSHQSENISD